jgi:DNA-binding NarL/FixJ family response regulator
MKYVLKTRIGSDLLAAVEEVLEGGQFVSCGLIAIMQSAGGS